MSEAGDRLRLRAQDTLGRFERVAADRPDLRPAAVAITLVDDHAVGPAFVITRRAATLRAHSGQWALPGGRLDEGETPTDAARRELHEELALDLPESAVIGLLDDYATRSGFVITPVVLWAGALQRSLEPAVAEVAAAYLIAVADIDVDPQLARIPESDAPVIRLPLLDRYVHAPTAAVLYQFREVVLHDRPTRVAHLEQPVFAWR